MSNRDLNQEVLHSIIEENQQDDERDFDSWCEYLLSIPATFELKPKFGDIDIELQPLRWMSSGIDLIQSRKTNGYVQLVGGVQGPAFGSYLPYAVFQMAAEVFLKGVWLCKYAECRELTASSYIDADRRADYAAKTKDLGHDLLEILGQICTIPEYRSDPAAMRFLDLIERVIRCYYFPPYVADKGSRWANARYPKRIYDDIDQRAQAEGLEHYPEAKRIETLFQRMEQDVNRLWQLRARLIARGE